MAANKWSKEQVLREAHRRAEAMARRPAGTQERWVRQLVADAGWTEEELMQALCDELDGRG